MIERDLAWHCSRCAASLMTIPTLTPAAPLTFDRFRLDADGGDLSGPSGCVPLSPKALAVLHYLARRPARLISKSELIEAHWADVFVADSVIRLCIREIRHAVEDDAKVPRFIETVHRLGYRFTARVSVVPARPGAAQVAASAETETIRPWLPSPDTRCDARSRVAHEVLTA